jgi:hypothetical protein
VLDALCKLIGVGDRCKVNGKNVIVERLLAGGGGTRLEELQMHPNKEVYDRTVNILTRYFELENPIEIS